MKMLFNLFLIFCFYLPFQFALNPSAGVDLASSRIFILVLFFAWLAESLRQKRFTLENNAPNFFVVSFLFFSFFSIFFAQNMDWSVRKLLFLFSVFPIYFISQRLIDNTEKMQKVIKALLFGGFFVAVLGIAQFLLQFVFGLNATYQFWAKQLVPIFLGENVTMAVLKNPSWLVNISGKTYLRSIATFPDPHMFSFYLGLLIPLALGMFFQVKRKVYLIIFLTLVVSDLLTFSRGGYLGLFFCVVLAFFFLLNKLERKYKIRIAVLVVFLLSFVVVPSPVSVRFWSSFDFQDGSNRGRLETWQKAGEVISDHAVTGVGIGNYPLEINPTASYREPIYAHSNYFDIMAESGIFALVAWLGFLISLVLLFLRKNQNKLFFCAGMSVLIFSVHALVETSIYSPTVLALFLIIASFNRLVYAKNN